MGLTATPAERLGPPEPDAGAIRRELSGLAAKRGIRRRRQNQSPTDTDEHGRTRVGHEVRNERDVAETLLVFVRSRPFPNKDQLRLGIAGTKDNVGAILAELAAAAVADIFANCLKI